MAQTKIWSRFLNLFSSTEAGIVPASGGGTTSFLRADGVWSPTGGGDYHDKYMQVDCAITTPLASITATNIILECTSQGVSLPATAFVLLTGEVDLTKNGIYKLVNGVLQTHTNEINEFNWGGGIQQVYYTSGKFVYVKNGAYSGQIYWPYVTDYGDGYIPSTAQTTWNYSLLESIVNNESVTVQYLVGQLESFRILQDSTHRFVTDTQITNWDKKRINLGLNSNTVIQTGLKINTALTIPFSGLFTRWTITTDVLTDTVVNVRKNGVLIFSLTKPSLTSQRSQTSFSVGENNTYGVNDVFELEVESNSAAKYILLTLS